MALVRLPEIKGKQNSLVRANHRESLRVEKSSDCALPGSCSMVAWLRLEKRRSSCGGESGGCRSSAYWEQRHLRSGLLVPLLITRLGTGVLAEIEEGRSRGQQ